MMPKAGLQNKEAKAALPDSEAQKLIIMDYLKLSHKDWWCSVLVKSSPSKDEGLWSNLGTKSRGLPHRIFLFMLWKELQLRPSSSDG